MKKKGFTLVELLGIIILLGLVLGLVVLAYVNNQGSVDTTYYKTLEKSLLIPGGDYFNYNKGEQPGVFGDEKRVSAQILKNGGYLEEDIVDSDKKTCDLQNSYVGAYKNSKDKTNYYVCLSCDSYKTDSSACKGEIDYTLGVRANKKESKDIYNPNGKNWSSEDIVFTFETLNDMQKVELESENGKIVGSCNLKEQRGIKSCTIEVSASGNYKAYAKSGKSETKKEELKVLIDKTKPEFEIQDKGVSGKIEVEVNSNAFEKVIENTIINIKDPESGIKSSEYSLEIEGKKDYYHSEGVVTSFKVSKNLKMGIHYLRVRVYNKAGLKTEKVIKYEVWKRIVDPTSEKYCNTLTYNSYNQTLTKSPGEGYTFSNTTGMNAKNYKIIVTPKENYRFNDLTSNPKTIDCKINPKPVTITAKPQTIAYQGEIVKNLDMVTTNGLISGHILSAITLNKNIVGSGKNKIIASNAKIMESSTDVTSNYQITYVAGFLTVNPRVTLSITGTKEQEGYQSGAKVTLKCESVDNITSFVVTSDTGSATTLSGGTIKSSVVTLNTNGKNRTIKGVCTTQTGVRDEKTGYYNIYVYTQNDVCSCATAKTCTSSCCGTKSCNCKDVCTEYTWNCVSFSGISRTGTASKCPSCGGTLSCKCTKSTSKCSTCNKSCTSEGCCGCKTRNSCWHL